MLTDVDYPYIYAILNDLANSTIAGKLGVSQATVKRKLAGLYEKVGVKTKKDMRDYLHKYM